MRDTAENWFVSQNYGVPDVPVLYSLWHFHGETSGRSKNFLRKAQGETEPFDFLVSSGDLRVLRS